MITRRKSFLFVLVFTLTTMLVACGGGGEQPAADESPAEPSADPATFGSLTLTANYEGEVPEPREVDASANSECNAETILKKTVDVTDGKLKNVVVSVESGPAGSEVSSPEAAKIDQQGCQYVPHVVTLKQGQTLEITDSDQGMHNIRATQNGGQLFNETTFQGQSVDKSFDEAGVFSLACDVHPWMNAYVYVTDSGKASVTDASGQATLADLPPGDYELTIWHEELGTQSQSVTIGENEDAELEVTFSG